MTYRSPRYARIVAGLALLFVAQAQAQEADAPMVEKMKTIGVVAGQPFDLAKLDPASVQAVEEGAKAALEGIIARGETRTGGSAGHDGQSRRFIS